MKSKYYLEYGLFLLLLRLVNLLPEKLLPSAGNILGIILYSLKLRRSVIMKNLEIAFGQTKDLAEREQICRDVYIHLSCVGLEFLRLEGLSSEQLNACVEIEGVEDLQEILREKGGVLCGMFHYGNWELQGIALSSIGLPLHVYTGRQTNPLVERHILSIRSKFGAVLIEKSKNSTFKMMKALQAGKVLTILGDLNVPHRHLFVDFFGRPASLGQGLPTFAVRKKTPFFFCWNRRLGNMKYKIVLKQLEIDSTGDTEKDIERLAQCYVDEMQEVIAQNPAQYFWINRRWKTSPSDETPSPYS